MRCWLLHCQPHNCTRWLWLQCMLAQHHMCHCVAVWMWVSTGWFNSKTRSASMLHVACCTACLAPCLWLCLLSGHAFDLNLMLRQRLRSPLTCLSVVESVAVKAGQCPLFCHTSSVHVHRAHCCRVRVHSTSSCCCHELIHAAHPAHVTVMRGFWPL